MDPTTEQAAALVPDDTEIRSLMRALCEEADALHRIHGPQFSVPGDVVRERVLRIPQEGRASAVLNAYRTLVVLGLPKLLLPEGRTLADYPESCSWRWPKEPAPVQQTAPYSG